MFVELKAHCQNNRQLQRHRRIHSNGCLVPVSAPFHHLSMTVIGLARPNLSNPLCRWRNHALSSLFLCIPVCAPPLATRGLDCSRGRSPHSIWSLADQRSDCSRGVATVIPLIRSRGCCALELRSFGNNLIPFSLLDFTITTSLNRMSTPSTRSHSSASYRSSDRRYFRK